MKKLLLAFICFLVGCTDAKYDHIPLLVYNMQDAYIQQFESHIQLASIYGTAIKTYDAKNSQIIQNQLLETVLKEGAKVVIVNPVDRLSAGAMVDLANKYKAKLVFINREPLNEDLTDNMYYVGAKAKDSAYLQAEIVQNVFGNNPAKLNYFDRNKDNVIQTIILKGEQGHQDAETRTKYIAYALRENNYNLEILDTVTANFLQQKAKEEVDYLINTLSNIELIVANNDDMALGAIKSLVEYQKIHDTNENGIFEHNEPFIPVVGIDGLVEAIEAIKAGTLVGTVVNDSQTMAEAVVELVNILYDNGSIYFYSFPIVDKHYIWIAYKKLTV